MAKSKFANVIGTLAKAEPEQGAYQDKVNAEKERLRSGEATSFSEHSNATKLSNALLDWLDVWSKDGAPSSHTPESLAKLYIKVSAELDELEAVRYDRQVRLNAIEQMLVDSHEADQPGWGLYGASEHTVKLASGACIDVLTQPSVSFVDREAFRQWCLAAGLEHKMHLPTATRDSITKERLIAGVSLPDGLAVKATSIVKYRRA